MPKKKDKKIIKRNEFRDNFGVIPPHTAYVYAKQGNYYFTLPITHSPITRRKPNVKMHKNPNNNPRPEDKGLGSYFVPRPTRTHKNKMGKHAKINWTLCEEDAIQMKQYLNYKFDK